MTNLSRFYGTLLNLLYTSPSGGSLNLDLSSNRVFSSTLTADVTLNFINVPQISSNSDGIEVTLVLKQDVVGGRIVTWPLSVMWLDNSAPLQQTIAGSASVYTFLSVDGGISWYGARRFATVEGGSGGYTDLNARDAIAAALVDTQSLEWAYDRPGGEIAATVRTDATISIGVNGLGIADSSITPEHLNTALAPTNLQVLAFSTSSSSFVWVDQTGGTPYTDAEAQDAVGSILDDSNSITLVYTPNTSIVAELRRDGPTIAVTASGVKVNDSSITATQLADGSVTTSKILDGAVTSDKILDSAVTSDKLADSAVVTDKLADSSVTTAKIFDSSVSTNKIAASAVVESKIANNAVTSAKLLDGAVTAIKLSSTNSPSSGQVPSYDLATGTFTWVTNGGGSSYTDAEAQDAVGLLLDDTNSIDLEYVPYTSIKASLRLRDSTLSVTGSGLGVSDLGIGTAQLSDSSIITSKINDAAVTTDKIVDGAVSENKINDAAVTTDKIATGAISSDKIADGSIITVKIADSAVTSDKLSSSSVTLEKLSDESVAPPKLVATNSPTDGQIPSYDAISGDFTWVDNDGGGSVYTDAQAQDAVASILVPTNSIEFTYVPNTSLSADVRLDGSTLSLSGSGLKVADGGIGTTQIANASVTEAKWDVTNDPSDTYLLQWSSSDGKPKWVSPSATGSYSDNDAINALGGALTSTDSIRWTYDSGTHKITANLALADSVLTIGATGLTLSLNSITTQYLQNSSVTYAKVSAAGTAVNGYVLTYDSSSGGTLRWVSPTSVGAYTDADAIAAVQGTINNTNGLSWTKNTTTTNVALVLDGSSLSLSGTGLRIANGGITSTFIADSAVTINKISPGSTHTANQILAVNATNNGLLWIDAPTTSYSDNQAIAAVAGSLQNSSQISWNYNGTLHQITGSIINASIGATQLASNAVTNVKILDGTIAEAKLDIVNTPTDQYILSWSLTDSKMKWISAAESTPPTGAAGGDLAGTYPNPQIADGAVTNAKLATMANQRIKGNVSGSTAAPSDLTGAQVTALLSNFVGSGASNAKGLVPAPGSTAGTGRFLREDATWASPLTAGSITNSTLAQMNALSIKANPSNALANATDFAVTGNSNNVLMEFGNGLSWKKVDNVNLGNMATLTIKGNATGSSAAPQDLTGAQVIPILPTFAASGVGSSRGLVPDPGSSAGSTKFLREDATWASVSPGASSVVPSSIDSTNSASDGYSLRKVVGSDEFEWYDPGSTTYTDAQAQDAVGVILDNDGSVSFTYVSNTSLSANVNFSGTSLDADGTGIKIANAGVLAIHIDTTNSPSDTFVLSWDASASRMRWSSPGSGGGGYTDNQAIAAVGTALQPSSGLSWTYDNVNNLITGTIVLDGSTLSKSISGLKVSDSSIGPTQLSISGTPDAGDVISFDGSALEWTTPVGKTASFGMSFQNDSPLLVNDSGMIQVECAGNITGFSVWAGPTDSAASLTIEVYKGSFGSVPVTVITGSGTKPSLSSSIMATSTTLTGWTTTFVKGDLFLFKIISTSGTLTNVTVALHYDKV